MNKTVSRTDTHRVITMLNRQEMDFLDKLGKDALFTTGHKLSYNDILKGLIDFAIELGVSAEGANSFAALKDRLIQAFPGYVEKLRQEKEAKNETPST